MFVGSRLALNDAQDTSVLFGVIVDANDGSIAGRLEAERRLSQRFLLEIESRFFTNVAPGNALNLFRQDSYLGVRIGYHF